MPYKWTLSLIVMLLLLSALVANLLVMMGGDTPSLTPSRGVNIALFFWPLVLADLCLSAAGIYLTSRSHRRRGSALTRWARWGFLVNGLVILTLAAVPSLTHAEAAVHARRVHMIEVSAVLMMLGVVSALFLASFYQEYRRRYSMRPRSRDGR